MKKQKDFSVKVSIQYRNNAGTVVSQTQCRCGSGGNGKCGGKCNK